MTLSAKFFVGLYFDVVNVACYDCDSNAFCESDEGDPASEIQRYHSFVHYVHQKRPMPEPCGTPQVVRYSLGLLSEPQQYRWGTLRYSAKECLMDFFPSRRIKGALYIEGYIAQNLFPSIVDLARFLTKLIASTVAFRNSNCLLDRPPSLSALGSMCYTLHARKVCR